MNQSDAGSAGIFSRCTNQTPWRQPVAVGVHLRYPPTHQSFVPVKLLNCLPLRPADVLFKPGPCDTQKNKRN
eukprot:6878024-Pyramimonas_sp.AAC.1